MKLGNRKCVTTKLTGIKGCLVKVPIYCSKLRNELVYRIPSAVTVVSKKAKKREDNERKLEVNTYINTELNDSKVIIVKLQLLVFSTEQRVYVCAQGRGGGCKWLRGPGHD